MLVFTNLFRTSLGLPYSYIRTNKAGPANCTEPIQCRLFCMTQHSQVPLSTNVLRLAGYITAPMLRPALHCEHNGLLRWLYLFLSHLKRVREQQTQYRSCFCRHCDRFFRTIRGLQNHRDSVHDYFCPDCEKRFDFGYALKQHQKSTGHSYCRVCDRSFAHEGALDNHNRAVHVPW